MTRKTIQLITLVIALIISCSALAEVSYIRTATMANNSPTWWSTVCMTPMQAVQAATIHAADLLGWPDKVAPLSPGVMRTSLPSRVISKRRRSV